MEIKFNYKECINEEVREVLVLALAVSVCVWGKGQDVEKCLSCSVFPEILKQPILSAFNFPNWLLLNMRKLRKRLF